MTSNVNDFVMLGADTNTLHHVAFEYESQISDGLIKPCRKDRGPEYGSSYAHTECTTLERMLKEYMSNKFFKMGPDGDTKIKVTLTDFWIEQYVTDSTGKAVLASMFGGEVNSVCVAKVKVLVAVKLGGVDYNKIIVGSAEETHVSSFGTGTKTSYLYRGKESIEHIHAKNINDANNKVLMMNHYFEELDL
jgi:hypothetical protein